MFDGALLCGIQRHHLPEDVQGVEQATRVRGPARPMAAKLYRNPAAPPDSFLTG